MSYEHGDPAYKNREDLIRCLTNGSPKLRILYTATRRTCFIEKSKLLVVEDLLLNAKLYEDSIRALWIHCETAHSKLTRSQRDVDQMDQERPDLKEDQFDDQQLAGARFLVNDDAITDSDLVLPRRTPSFMDQIGSDCDTEAPICFCDLITN